MARLLARSLTQTFVTLACFCVAAQLSAYQCHGQDGATQPDDNRRGSVIESTAWKFETIRLRRGDTYEGLIRSETEDEIEFIEIQRPPGKPMFAVVRPIPANEVQQLQRLPEDDHRELERRFQRFRTRARVEAGEMDRVRLQAVTVDGGQRQRYEGQWFTIESTADEEMTRRCVVRIEQIFRAYRLLLPPRISDPPPFRVVLFGSLDQYRAHLRQMRLELDAPAFYSAKNNEIVAGSPLNGYAERLRQTNSQIEQARRELKRLEADFASRIERLRQQMRENNFNDEEIDREVLLRKARWNRELEIKMTAIARTQRYNNDYFREITDRMFRRLSHEAFHAYLENYVIRSDDGTLPRWLNEGLAQVFETAQLDAEILRVDAPSRDKLLALQADLQSDNPLAIADVLVADENTFLVAHGRQESQRHYLYSWGLAYHLLFDLNLLADNELLQYAKNRQRFGPSARFTALTGMPLLKFEKQWRAAMLSLAPPR